MLWQLAGRKNVRNSKKIIYITNMGGELMVITTSTAQEKVLFKHRKLQGL